MLGDGTCHSECLNAACDYDGGDCEATLCSPGCYPSMEDNGVCDGACYTSSCGWDGSDCDCSAGCTSDLLTNAQCDPQCNTARCGWDGCGCAPDCSYAELGQCKPQCLVADCGFDALPGFPMCADARLRRASKAYHLALLILGANNVYLSFDEQCENVKNCWSWDRATITSIGCLFDECKGEYCSYMYQDCDAVPNCSGAFSPSYGSEYLCVECAAPLKNSFGSCSEACAPGLTPHPYDPSLCVLEEDTTSEENPLKVFVSANYTAPDADGSESRPFPIFSQALKHATKHYSMVVLMDAEHTFADEFQSILLFDFSISRRTPLENQWVVWILPYGCLFASSCERAQLTRTERAVSLAVPGYIPNSYGNCNSLKYQSGELRISNINFVDKQDFNNYGDLLIVQYGSLVLRNVSFIDVMASSRIFNMETNSSVILEDVDFTRVRCISSCITQHFKPCQRGVLPTLLYRGGTVSFQLSIQENFISLWNMRNVTIENVTFAYNTGEPQSNAIIKIKNCCLFVLAHCIFANNTFETIYAVAIVPEEWSPQNTFFTEYLNVTNIVIDHVSFYNNSYTTGSSINIVFPRSVQRVVISNCLFEGESAQSCVLAASSTQPVSPEQIRGPSYYPAPFHRVDLPPGFFRLINVQANHCYSGSDPVFTIANLAYVEVSGFRLRTAPALRRCVPAIWVNASYEVTLTDIFFADSYCESGYPGMRLSTLTGRTVLTNLSFTDITAQALLFAEDIFNLLITDAIVFNCSNAQLQDFGGVQLAGNSTVAILRNVTWEQNRAGTGGALFISMVLHITLLNCTFRNNSAATGGAVLVSPQGQAGTSIEVKDCLFTANSASVAGVVYVQYTPPSSSLRLSILSSNFTENQAYKCAGLSVSAGVEMQAGSVIEDSQFARHYAASEGVLSLSYFFGDLQVLNSRFTDNKGDEDSAIFVNHGFLRAQALVTFTLNSVKFENNTGTAVVRVLDSDLKTTVYITAVEFANNSGTALSVTSAQVVAWNATFRSNSAASGPAVSLFTSAKGDFADTVFEGNVAALSAGAVLSSESSVFACTSCQFFENYAGANGGAVMCDQKAKLALSAVTFARNRAKESGSAVCILMSIEDSVIQNSTFEHNTAGSSGVLYMFYSTLSITHSTISANSAPASPGISLSLSTLSVSSTVFSAQPSEAGWFLHIPSLSTCQVQDSTFRDCSGATIGAIYLEEGTVTIAGSQFFNLSAQYGSVAYVASRASLTMSDCRISNQTSAEMGIVAVLQTRATVRGCQFLSYSGSAIWGQNALLNITNSEFAGECYLDGKGSSGVGIYCEECPSAVIVGSAFTGLKGQQGSGVRLSNSGEGSGSHEISHCVFLNLTGDEGAAVQVANANMIAKRSQFLRNTALQASGGAIALSCTIPGCAYLIEHSDFAENRAALNGGAIAWDGIEPELIDNSYSSNTAQYGENYSSFPTHISTDNTTVLPPTPSGQVAPYYLVITLRDHYNQTVATENNTKAALAAVDPESTRVLGLTEITAVKGVFRFDGFIVEAKPGSSTQVKVTPLTLDFGIVLTVPMRDCMVGESLQANKCHICEAGKYSFDPSKACQDCMSEATCEGGFIVTPKPGYWRADYLQTKLFQCPNPEACLGQTLTGLCAKGYDGNKCQTCAKRYFRTSKVFCDPCPSKATVFTKMLFIFLGTLLFAIFIVLTSITSALRTKAKTSVYLKILMNYLQLVMLMGAFNLSWPSYVQKLLEIQDSAGGFSEQLTSSQCMHDDYDESSEFYAKTVAMALVPVAVTAASSIVWVVIAVLSRNYGKMHRELVGSAVVLFFLLHPSVMRAMFAVFNCEEIRAGEYWVTGMNLRCWVDQHWKYAFGVALPCIIVWGIGVPALILILLIVKRSRLSHYDYKMRFGFLYNGYRTTRYYWEFVVIYRKLVIISLSVFLSRMAVIRQALLALVVLLFSQYLHSVSQPYTAPALNVAEHRSLLVSTVTLFAGLYYLGGAMSEVLNVLFFVGVIGVNVYFLVFWVRESASAWVILLVMRVKCLQRFCVKVGEDRIVFRSRRVSTVGMRSSQQGDRKLSEFFKVLYYLKLKNQEITFSLPLE